jgi:hypothetical protein
VSRVAAALVLAALLVGGCSRTPGVRSRGLAKGILLVVAAAAAGGAAGAAVMSDRTEKSLRDDLAAGSLTGRAFAVQDDEGRRWNRIGRASVLVGGLAIVGLVITWQMALADRYQYGPPELPKSAPIFPAGSPGATAPRPPQSWADAR